MQRREGFTADNQHASPLKPVSALPAGHPCGFIDKRRGLTGCGASSGTDQFTARHVAIPMDGRSFKALARAMQGLC